MEKISLRGLKYIRVGVQVTELNGMIRVGFIEEVTFEPGFETDKRVSHKDT